MRTAALRQAGAYNPAMIAGEEPELCCRLRLAGWQIVRLETEMTLHDAALHHFSQWWQRTRRAGHAYAEGAWLHGRSELRHNVRETQSIVLWGLLVPGVGALGPALALATGVGPFSLLAVAWLGYPVLAARIFVGQRSRGRRPSDAALYALACVAGKLPNALGLLQFLRTRNRSRTLIEYK